MLPAYRVIAGFAEPLDNYLYAPSLVPLIYVLYWFSERVDQLVKLQRRVFGIETVYRICACTGKHRLEIFIDIVRYLVAVRDDEENVQARKIVPMFNQFDQSRLLVS